MKRFIAALRLRSASPYAAVARPSMLRRPHSASLTPDGGPDHVRALAPPPRPTGHRHGLALAGLEAVLALGIPHEARPASAAAASATAATFRRAASAGHDRLPPASDPPMAPPMNQAGESSNPPTEQRASADNASPRPPQISRPASPSSIEGQVAS
jgi:hypothetical protein